MDQLALAHSTQGILVVYLTVVAIIVYGVSQWVLRLFRSITSLPKGPWGYPILGSFFCLKKYPELTLHKWAQKYGPLYSFAICNQLFVVVSDPGIAKDLLIANGAIFSDRKDMFVKSQTILLGRGITSNPYDDRWRKHRRIAAAWLNQRSVDRFTAMFDFETTSMIKALYRDSANSTHINPQAYAGHCSFNSMTAITFGFRTSSITHLLVRHALALSREFMNTTGPVSNLVDFVPGWLQISLPWEMKRRGKQLHAALVNTYGGLIKRIENDIHCGVHVEDCLAKTMIVTKDREQLDDLDMAMLASAFMVGGVETTASIIQWFSALISTYRHVQNKAHEELDRVVGRNRLPNIQDEANLPYCRSIIKEVERFRNPFWLGTPHVASKDFLYKGTFIPEGSVVVLNTWTMHHDPARWTRPMEFNPDRYLNDGTSSSDSAKLSNPHMRDHWTFGAGRRICPGMLVAQREIWLAISKMLWAFELMEIPDKPVDLREYDGMSGRSPVPFEIVLRPRFEGVEKVIGRVGELCSL